MKLLSNDYMHAQQVRNSSFPRFKGKVTVKLHNVHNGKNEVYESHNAPTNALADMFGRNYGGLLNYQNFADLYRTFLGGVLVFGNPLDPTNPADYGIPASASNPCRAHAGQATISDQADDLTRGNPDSSQTVLTGGTTKLVWEWGTSAGNGVISSLGLTHSDVGSYGCGVNSAAQKNLSPFVNIGCLSREYSYGDNADTVLGINGNTAYTFYLVDNTTVDVFKTPINNTKFKLQGGSLLPLTAYTTKITATLPNSYAIGGKGECYYHFDFANNKLILFGVPTQEGATLYRDDIDLDSGVVTHQTITVTGVSLWKFRVWSSPTGYTSPLNVPVKAMIYNNHLFVYGTKPAGSYNTPHPRSIYKINLANTSDITEVDTTDFDTFDRNGGNCITERFANAGGIIVHESFLINNDKTFELARNDASTKNYAIPDNISSPSFGIGTNLNMISACKLYLATKYNLPSSVTKTSAQSMTVTYELTEV